MNQLKYQTAEALGAVRPASAKAEVDLALAAICLDGDDGRATQVALDIGPGVAAPVRCLPHGRPGAGCRRLTQVQCLDDWPEVVGDLDRSRAAARRAHGKVERGPVARAGIGALVMPMVDRRDLAGGQSGRHFPCEMAYGEIVECHLSSCLARSHGGTGRPGRRDPVRKPHALRSSAPGDWLPASGGFPRTHPSSGARVRRLQRGPSRGRRVAPVSCPVP